MVDVGDSAPAFTAPLATGEVEEFDLEARLEEAPLVLAFFPGAFTEVCSHEMNAFQERLDAFAEAGASVYGVSVDSPFALNAFRDRLGLAFGLVSDANKAVVEAYDVAIPFEEFGIDTIADRVVFVVDGDGEITYRWEGEHPAEEPDYDTVLEAARAAAATA